MDPDAVMRRLRDALSDFGCAGDDEEAIEAANEFGSAFADLDGWLSKGGFLPREWAR